MPYRPARRPYLTNAATAQGQIEQGGLVASKAAGWPLADDCAVFGGGATTAPAVLTLAGVIRLGRVCVVRNLRPCTAEGREHRRLARGIEQGTAGGPRQTAEQHAEPIAAALDGGACVLALTSGLP